MSAPTLPPYLTAERIRSIRAPIEQARTLPREAFTDPRFLALEIDRIYSRHWVALAFEVDLPRRGDVVPVELCGMPLLLVRGADGRIRAFHNVVPYDGCLAAIDRGEALSRIETPYHGWVYDLEGRLLARPYWDGSRDGGPVAPTGHEVDLKAVACDVFLGAVCVNLSADAVSLGRVTDAVLDEFDEYDFAKAAVLADADGAPVIAEGTVGCNWKTYFENACINVLHESFVHALYRASPLHPRVREDGSKTFFEISRGLLLGLGYRHGDFVETYGETVLPTLGRGGRAPDKSTFATLYPNLYLSIAPEAVEVGFALPDGPEATRERRLYLVHQDVASDASAREAAGAVVAGFAEAGREDARVCEAVQRARHSPAYAQHFYSPFWDVLHHRFSQLLLDDLES